MKNKINQLIIVFVVLFCTACNKFLDEKPDQKLAIPTTAKDLQALMENYTVMNARMPVAGEASADNFYLTGDTYSSMNNIGARNAYTWSGENVFVTEANEWANLYRTILIANIVLENIDKIERTSTNITECNITKGNALFYRSFSFLNGVTVWSKAYDEATSESDLGIPLRYSSELDVASFRSNVKECYLRICEDLKQSLILLPDVSISPVRPTKVAAYALLARTYLFMRKYDLSLLYSDSAIRIKPDLMNFSNDPEVDLINPFPFKKFNKEVIFDAQMTGMTASSISNGQPDSVLMNQYAEGDLRKQLYYYDLGGGAYIYMGMYNTGEDYFSGLATDEIYLIRAECLARGNKVDLAFADLNKLLINRYLPGKFTPLAANSSDEALTLILAERRKELTMRGLRWMDIKRLNKEGRNIILKRNLAGKILTLEPNSTRYALPLPENVVSVTGMKQN